MNYSTPFVHAFEIDNHKYLYDVNTNRVLQVNDIIYDIINYYGRFSASEIAKKLHHKYDLDSIEREISEIDAAKREGLFSSFRPERIQYSKGREEIEDLLETEMSSITLNVTEDCNMRCKYCVYGGNYEMMRTHSKKYMNFDIAKKAIDYYLLHSTDNREELGINVGFYGGEPLLNFELIKDCVEYVNSRKIGSENVTYNMTTNGTILNDKIIDFLIANNFHLLVSLDGPKPRHDKYRVFPNGTGSFDIIMKNLQKIQRKNPDYYRFNVSFSLVIAPPVDYIEVDNFFSDSEVIGEHYSITSTPVTPGAEFLKQFDHEELTDAEGNEKLWRKYVDGLLQHTSRDPLYLWEYAIARTMFESYLLPIYDCPPYDRLAKEHYAGGICIPGHRKLFVSAEGLFYICERVRATGNENDLYCIGNVETGIDHNKVFRLIDEFCSTTELDCCRCWAARLCPVCFAPIVPGDDQKTTANEKRQTCQSARESVHDALIKFYSVIESDPKAFDFMDNIDRMRY